MLPRMTATTEAGTISRDEFVRSVTQLLDRLDRSETDLRATIAGALIDILSAVHGEADDLRARLGDVRDALHSIGETHEQIAGMAASVARVDELLERFAPLLDTLEARANSRVARFRRG